MESIDRRKFIKSLFVGLGAISMPSFVYGLGTKENTTTPETSVNPVDPALVQRAKQAFYKKNYAEAERLYKQLIESEPSNIIWYDGLRKVYGARQQLFPIASLYKQGLAKNPDKPVFYDRLARSVKSIAMGSRQEENLYKGKFGSEDLLLATLSIYITAISKFPGDASLRLGLKDAARSFDVRKTLKQRSDKLPAALTDNIRKYLTSVKDKRNKPEADTKNVSVEESVTVKIARMETKKRRELYFDKEKENRREAILKHRKHLHTRQVNDSFASGNIIKAKRQIEKVLKENPKETSLIGALKKQARKAKDRNIVVAFYEEQYKAKRDFWTTIGYAVALRKQNYPANFTKIISLYDEAGTLASNSGKEQGALYLGRALTYLETGRFSECRKEVLKTLEKTNGCGNISLKLSINYAKSYAEENDYVTALNLLQLLKGKAENEAEMPNDPIVRYIRPDSVKDEEIYMIQQLFPHERTKTEKLDVLYTMAKIQKKQGEGNALRQTLEEIKTIDPENQFVYKYI